MSVEFYGAFIGFDDACDDVEASGFSGSVGSEESEDFAAIDVEVYIFEDLSLSISFLDMFYREFMGVV